MKIVNLSKISLALVFCLLFTMYFTILPSQAESRNPQLHLKFDGDFKDASGNGYDAVKFGNVTFTDKGAIGKGADFEGGYLELANSSGLNFTKNMTISAWIRSKPNISNAQNIFFKPNKEYPDESIHDFRLNYTSLSSRIGRVDGEGYVSGGSNYYSSYIDSEILQEKWTHVCMTFDGESVIFYVDGMLNSQTSVIPDDIETYPEIATSDKKVRIGFNGGGEDAVKGYLDDLRLYGYTMTAEQVEGVYKEVPQKNKKIVLQIENPKMEVNGIDMAIDGDRGTAPTIDSSSGRTLLPIRAVVEAMNGTISWNGTEGRVDVNCKGTLIKLWIGKKQAIVNGVEMTLDVFPKIINGRTMMPLRFIAENLNADVNWNGDEKKITVMYN